jgi:hypothetical protein
VEEQKMNGGRRSTGSSTTLGTVLIALVLVLASCGTNPSPPTSVADVTTPAATASAEARARRYLANVWAGSGGDAGQLTDDDWHEIQPGDQVRTDVQGECWLDIEDCLRIYLFQAGRLVKAACPKSNYRSGNVLCAAEGTAVFNNRCASRVTIQTDTASITLQGTWVSVTYLPQRQLSLVMVFSGSADAQPVEDPETYALSGGSIVGTGTFWFTTPGPNPLPIAGLSARTPYPFDRISPLFDELQLWPWAGRIAERGQQDGIPLPPELQRQPAPTATAAATTVPRTEDSNTPTPTVRPAITPTQLAPTPTSRPTVAPTPTVMPAFRLTVTASSQSVVQGGSTRYPIQIAREGGFRGPVSFEVRGLPTGAKGSFNPNPATEDASTLTVTTSRDVEFGSPAGSYPLTITATASGQPARSTVVTLIVQDFALTVPSIPVTVTRGEAATFPVTINRLQRFPGPVSLSVSSTQPVTGRFSQNPATGASATLAISTTGLAPGTYYFQVVGTSGELTRYSNVGTLIVRAPVTTTNETPVDCTTGCHTRDA